MKIFVYVVEQGSFRSTAWVNTQRRATNTQTLLDDLTTYQDDSVGSLDYDSTAYDGELAESQRWYQFAHTQGFQSQTACSPKCLHCVAFWAAIFAKAVQFFALERGTVIP